MFIPNSIDDIITQALKQHGFDIETASDIPILITKEMTIQTHSKIEANTLAYLHDIDTPNIDPNTDEITFYLKVKFPECLTQYAYFLDNCIKIPCVITKDNTLFVVNDHKRLLFDVIIKQTSDKANLMLDDLKDVNANYYNKACRYDKLTEGVFGTLFVLGIISAVTALTFAIIPSDLFDISKWALVIIAALVSAISFIIMSLFDKDFSETKQGKQLNKTRDDLLDTIFAEEKNTNTH